MASSASILPQLACIIQSSCLDAQVADQAENRMLAAQAVLLHCCGLRGLWHPLRRDSGRFVQPAQLRRVRPQGHLCVMCVAPHEGLNRRGVCE